VARTQKEPLSRLLATIPTEVQREGLSLASLQASLRGRWRGNCHPGELGSALRKLGFKRERRWHDDGALKQSGGNNDEFCGSATRAPAAPRTRPLLYGKALHVEAVHHAKESERSFGHGADSFSV
jgi:hypothetical protein